MTDLQATRIATGILDDNYHVSYGAVCIRIANAILTACEEEASETKAAVESEREACAEVTDAYDVLDDIISTLIRARGTTDALAEALRKARLEEEEWWSDDAHQAVRELTEATHDLLHCAYCKRVSALQHPEVKEPK